MAKAMLGMSPTTRSHFQNEAFNIGRDKKEAYPNQTVQLLFLIGQGNPVIRFIPHPIITVTNFETDKITQVFFNQCKDKQSIDVRIY